MASILTTWEVSTYDVWGNKDDGYEVNDVYHQGEITLRLKVEVNNAGTPQEFVSAYPTDRQLMRVFGVRCAIDVDGDDLSIYVNRASDGYQLGQLFCTSHHSLGPIRPKETPVPGDLLPPGDLLTGER